MYRFIPLLLLVLINAGCASLPGATAETRQLERRADDGDAKAQYQLGLRLTSGSAVTQDYRRGIEAFRAAAKQGHTAAQFMLGMAYYTGRGIARDSARARHWLTLAAKKDHPAAEYFLGKIFLDGDGVTAEPTWGMYWVGLAAEQGWPEAQYSLGVGLLSGLGNKIDRQLGFLWLSRAAAAGYAPATYLLERLNQKAATSKRWHTQSSLSQLKQRYRNLYIQTRLQQLDRNTGPIDGIWGTRTQKAAAGILSNSAGWAPDEYRQRLIQRLRTLEREAH